MAYAETKSSRISLRDTNSPQYKAVEWLAQDKVDNLSNWSGYELLQRYVLRVLYHSTGGENWSGSPCCFDADTTWFGASRVCDWGSIDAQCNGNGQQVDRVLLDNVNLQGAIPDELGQLTALTWLSLDFSQLTGTLPSQLGQLTALTWLSLGNNKLTGTIPVELGELISLTTFRLSTNQLTGPIPSQLGQLTVLTYLGLAANKLTSRMPTQLGQLAALALLYLFDNQLTGTMPSHLGQLTALQVLSLSNNQLTGTIPTALTQLVNLELLYLYNNDLTGQVPFGFCASPFPNWRADGTFGNQLVADCIDDVQCDCCDNCFDESGNRFCWTGSQFNAC